MMSARARWLAGLVAALGLSSAQVINDRNSKITFVDSSKSHFCDLNSTSFGPSLECDEVVHELFVAYEYESHVRWVT